VRRPEPERTQPIRSWTTLFGAGAPPPARPASAPPASPAPAPTDPVSRGVEAGYRVIDDYVRQGQSAARLVWGPVLGGANGAVPGSEDLQQRMGMMVRSATDLMTMWLELFGSAPWTRMPGFPFAPATPAPGAVPIAPFSMGPPPPPPAPVPASAPVSPAPIISIDVASARRTEVIVDLPQRQLPDKLRVLDLRAPDGEAPRLGGVTIERPGEDRLVVRLRVPDDHPPGLYSGLILDEATSLPRGTLAVRIIASGVP
jgi:hypothetical protein